jgi:hypothetical protein
MSFVIEVSSVHSFRYLHPLFIVPLLSLLIEGCQDYIPLSPRIFTDYADHDVIALISSSIDGAKNKFCCDGRLATH